MERIGCPSTRLLAVSGAGACLQGRLLGGKDGQEEGAMITWALQDGWGFPGRDWDPHCSLRTSKPPTSRWRRRWNPSSWSSPCLWPRSQRGRGQGCCERPHEVRDGRVTPPALVSQAGKCDPASLPPHRVHTAVSRRPGAAWRMGSRTRCCSSAMRTQRTHHTG